MTIEPNFNRDTEWLLLAQPLGLVVSPLALKESGLVAARQTPVDTSAVRPHIENDEEKPALINPWAFFSGILGWRPQDVAGSPGGGPIPVELHVRLTDLSTTLEPTWAVRAAKGAPEDCPPHQLLVRIEAPGIEPDAKKALDGWEATPQQRFERLLRETKVFAGLLITGKEIRLVYAPQGETSGWQAFPIRALTSVPGRPILGGLKLLLDRTRFFGEPNQRLTALLKRSRAAQATVSTELSAQVLGALHELLRGLMAAEQRTSGTLLAKLAREEPHHLYEGLLTVLMRLVFVLYAEDRDLIPSRTEREARWLYDQGYSVRGLFARLSEDEALNPDTMDERVGGWGQLLALFRLIQKGHGSGFIRARGGKLFDPDAFLFLEGRRAKGDVPTVMSVSDGCLLRILRGLMLLKGERLSYRALDVEAIGSVYETVMGFTVEETKGASLAIKAGKNNKVPVFVDLDALAAMKPADRVKHIKAETGRALTDKQEKLVKAAKTATDMSAALESIADERGSPERGAIPAGSPVMQPTDERRRTGSHYTPRSLTLPIVLHALEPTFERLGPDATPAQILDLKVCDPAMGSGAFLVEACRQLGARLQQAWTRWPDQKPKVLPEDEDEELHAKRLVAQRCLYGVDKNPMAVDLAKLSLWLATLARDHEFEFVDHALKCGDSLVGLTVEQIAAATWDESKPGLPLFQKLVRDRIKESFKGRQEIRDAPDHVFRAVQEARHRNAEERIIPMRVIGDAVISAFFAESKDKARQKERARIESLITGQMTTNLQEVFIAALRLAGPKHPLQPFHWQLEFPEVFEGKHPGFDAIVGNPPFLGGKRISNELGFTYNEWLEDLHVGASRNADLVAHFFRRAFSLLRKGGSLGLIATNTIGQGDTRSTGLTKVLDQGGSISHATRRLKWPGEAAVVVSLVHVCKGAVGRPILDDQPVRRISAYLVEGDLDVTPKPLVANARKAFVGSYVLGMGFTFDDDAAAKGRACSLADMGRLIAQDKRNASRIFPYIGGEEINNEPRQAHRRFVIDFFDRPLQRDSRLGSWFNRTEQDQDALLTRGVVPADYPGECAEDWPDLLAIVHERAKPERDIQKRQALRERWWQYADKRPGLYRSIANLNFVIATCRVSNTLQFVRLVAGTIFADSMVIFAYDKYAPLCIIQARVHEVWARFFASSMKDDLRYTPSDCFATFPFPLGFETDTSLEVAGQAYHDHRAALMVRNDEGLTKTYNRFHNPQEDSADIIKLRELHDAMDRAVLTAYGWTDLAERIATDPDAMPRHLTEETEDDHKYQGRYFWPAPIRDEVLALLLALNATRAEEERLAGLEPPTSDDEAEETSDTSSEEA